MTARALVLAILVLAATPLAAAAKGVEKAEACGTTQCTAAVVDENTYLLFAGPREAARAPAKTKPYYKLRWGQFVENSVEFVPMKADFVPRAGLLRMPDGTWERPDRRAAVALQRRLTGIKAFGVPRRRPARAQAGGMPAAAIGGAAFLLVAGGLVALRRRRPAAG